MLIAEQIAKYMNSNNIALFNKTGTNSKIFIDTNPGEQVENVFSIYHKPSLINDVGLRDFKNVSLQVLYRGNKNPFTSYSKALDCFNLLEGAEGVLVSGGNYIISILSNQGSPECIGQTKKGSFEYSMNFDIEYVV